MGVVTHGMDTVAGLQASGELERGCQDLAALTARLHECLHAFDWLGADAERVRQDWAGTHRPVIERVTTQVAAFALLIRREAEAQDAASADGSAPSATLAGGTPPSDPAALSRRELVDRLAAAGLRQPDGTTCGSSSLVMSRMVNDPAYAAYILTGRHPMTGAIDARSAQERFAEESLRMHERTNGWTDRDGDRQSAWPLALGTAPGALAREMSSVGGSGVPGTTYGVDYVRWEDRGASFDKIVAASRAGHTVPVYVGGPGLPRHIVLATATDGGSISFYEPGAGQTVTVTREAWLRDGAGLGGWDRPWAVVVPSRRTP